MSKSFEGGSAKGVEVILGSEQFIPGFEEGLIGVKVGETRILDLNFPENYNQRQLAGKSVQFEIVVHQVQEKVPSEIDADFAKRIGIEEGEVGQVKDKVRSNMESYLTKSVTEQMRDKALEALYDKQNAEKPFDIPQALLEREYHSMLRQSGMRRDRELPGIETLDDAVLEKLKKRVGIGLLLNEIVNRHSLKPSESDIQAKIKALASEYDNAESLQKMYYESKEMLQAVENSVLTDMAADLVVNSASTVDKPSTYFKVTSGMVK